MVHSQYVTIKENMKQENFINSEQKDESDFSHALSSITGQMRPAEDGKMGFDYLQGTTKIIKNLTRGCSSMAEQVISNHQVRSSSLLTRFLRFEDRH